MTDKNTIKKQIELEETDGLTSNFEKLPIIENEKNQPVQTGSNIDFAMVKSFWDEKEGKTRKKLAVLFILIILLAVLIIISIQYLNKPEPLPDMLPVQINMNYAPHYLFSIYGVSQPVGVAVSPDGNRIYATESGGESMVRYFDRDGNLINSFYAPFLLPGERSPVYIDVAPDSNVFVTDRLQHSVFIFNSDGKYLDAMVGPSLSISEYVSKHSAEKIFSGSEISYSRFRQSVTYTLDDEKLLELPLPDLLMWAPLGVSFTSDGKILFTDVTDQKHSVLEIVLPVDWKPGLSYGDFNPMVRSFGDFGQDNGKLNFPNLAVEDSQGRFYVSDGNNSRVSIWDHEGNFLYNIGTGSGTMALDLPRGMVIDQQDRLFVVDAVNQSVKVFDVSAEKPAFLHLFGVTGTGDGQFNYPNDIAIDRTGRLYIADRENNRIQVWSY